MTVHVAPQLCDGRQWHGNGWLRIENGHVTEWGVGAPYASGPVVRHGCLLPGLVDVFGHVTGFHNRTIQGDALLPHQECLGLLIEAGVGTVCDVAGHAEIGASLAELATADWPILQWTGPIVDGPPVVQPAARVVTSPEAAVRAVHASAVEGAGRIYTGSGLTPELLAAVVGAARQHGLPVTHRPGITDAGTAARLGVECVAGLTLCALPPGRPPAATDLIRAWAQPAVRRQAEQNLTILAEHRVGLIPLLHSARRSVLLDEVVAEPRLERLLRIAPFHQYLLDMRGPGLVFGRRYARSYLNYEHLNGKARAEFDAGWQAVEEALAGAYRIGVPLLAGSGAAGVSLVPGFALHDELAWWVHAGVPREAALVLATGVGARFVRGADGGPWDGGALALPAGVDHAPSIASALASASFIARPVAVGRSGTADQLQPQEARA